MTPKDILDVILVLTALMSGLALTVLLIRHIILETARFDQMEREFMNPQNGDPVEF